MTNAVCANAEHRTNKLRLDHENCACLDDCGKYSKKLLAKREGCKLNCQSRKYPTSLSSQSDLK